MRMLRTTMIAALLSLATLPAQSADTLTVSETLLVGGTNIYCVQAPCPWRGIARDGEVRSGPAGLLWSGEELPQLEASAADAARLETAWDDGKCLAVQGRWTGSVLEVDRITGACP